VRQGCLLREPGKTLCGMLGVPGGVLGGYPPPPPSTYYPSLGASFSLQAASFGLPGASFSPKTASFYAISARFWRFLAVPGC